MNNLIKWLERHNIQYSRLEPWALIFAGNHPEAVLISANYSDQLIRYRRRNPSFNLEYRGNYETIYCYPVQEEALT